jgi:hypothetical protein
MGFASRSAGGRASRGRWAAMLGAFALVASGAVSALSPAQADASHAPRVAQVSFRKSPSVPNSTVSWDTGACPTFLPTDNGIAPPGDVPDNWAPLQQEAISQTEELYGQNSSSDPSSVYADDYARGVTRAFMFADLVQAIDDVAAGKATTTETSEVSAFAKVVQYGREWVALDAQNLFDSFSSASAVQSSVTNDVLSVIFGAAGLPWQNQSLVPSVNQLLDEAQANLWGAPGFATDSGGNQLQNYALASAESQQAMQQALDSLVFLNAIGQSQATTGGTGTDSALDTTMAQIENAIGEAGGAGDLATAIGQLDDIASDLAGTSGTEHASLIESLVNVVWQGADTAATDFQIVNNETASQALPTAAQLQSALETPATFDELFSDFVAMTLHSTENAEASGNDPDCRQTYKVHNGTTPAGPTSSDPSWTVLHFTPGSPGTADYSYQSQALGGARTDPNNHSGEISDPGVIDWSLTRDTGPGAPRLGTNWPITEVTYGVPGPPGTGYGLRSPAAYYPAYGSWYLTFNGADGQQHQTAPLEVGVSNGTVYPTDSQVEQAIINADPDDFAQQPCSGPDASDLDPAVPAGDQGQGPCTDWNFVTHTGTDVLVSGNQPDGNTNAPPDYQAIFDIMVKGDLGGWDPVFTAHTSPCASGGICVFSLVGIPLAGDNITSQAIWPMQQSDVCVNDPATCSGNGTFGWGDQASSPEPQPYPVAPECQSASPVAGLLQIEYVGEEGGNPSCDSAQDAASWVPTPSLRYQSYDGSFWTAWRVPSSVGTDSLLNIETAAVSSGQAGIDPNCGAQVSGDANATCLVGQGTHWTSEFQPGDQILLEAPGTASGNGTGGLESVVRTVGQVLDDTHMVLTSSAECLSGSDGNDCDFFNTSAYTSFMNPADGSQGDQSGMLTLPCGDDCISAPPNFQFNIWKLTGINAGTNCTTWQPTASSPHPPASGCYYSDFLQFRAQDGTTKGWWDAYLPPETSGGPARHHTFAPHALSEPWLNAPKLTSTPQNALAGTGGTATFSVTATGSPAPVIQWQVSTNHASTWSSIAGATSGTYSVPVTAAESGNDYRAVVENSSGSRTTPWGTLDVVSAPVITENPKSTTTVKAGQTFSFDSAATGDPAPTPTWQISQDGGATWQTLETGRADVTFTLPKSPAAGAARLAAAGSPQDLVRVVYQNAYGTATSTSAALSYTSTLPDVTVSAAVSPTPAAAGYPATAQITVGDYSTVKATSVKAVTTFSTALGYKSFKQISGPKAACTAKAVKGGETQTCTWATLAAHGQAKFQVSLLPRKGAVTGTVAAAVTIAQQNASLGLDTLTVPVSKPWADLQLTGTAPKTAAHGARFTDALTVRNAGPAKATKGKVVVTLPSAYKVVKASAPSAKCSTSKGQVTCTMASILAGHTVKLTLTLTTSRKGATTVVAALSAATPDYVPANNSLSLSTLIK